MKNMKVTKKLLICFMIVIALAVAIGVVGIVGMYDLNAASSEMYKYNLVAIQAMGNLRELFGSERSDIRNIFLSQDDPEKVKSLIAGFDTYRKTAEENFAVYDASIQDITQESEYLAAKEAYLGSYASLKTEVFALAGEGRFDEAYATFMGGSAVISPISNGFTVGSEKNSGWANDKDHETNALFSMLTIILVAVMGVAVIVSVTLALYISRMISSPVKFMKQILTNIGSEGKLRLSDEEFKRIRAEAKHTDEVGESLKALFATVLRLEKVGAALESVAGGDLTAELDLLSPEDTMGVSLQSMINNLNNMFGEIKTAAEQVSTGSKQISDGAQSLAQGSTEQAASVQQLSASINEIAEKTKENAKTAREAAGLSESIKHNAEKGSAQMEQMMQAVREINDASNQIEKVIKVIDDIAFQTNILALNAAVEAARAGSAGKGFAVVAEEVRNLAAKSADAAKDTGGLIENSVAKANMGLNMANDTSASLREIVDGINRSAEIIASIAMSSDEQAGAIQQVNTGIDQVAQVVQQNSATAQESAAASQEMSGQSDMLDQLISQFKTKDTGRRSLSSGYRAAPKKAIEPPHETHTYTGGDYGKY